VHWGTVESQDTKHKSKQPHFNDRQSLTELRVICAIAGEWLKPIRQSRGLIPIRRNLSRKVEIANVDIRELSEYTAFQYFLHFLPSSLFIPLLLAVVPSFLPSFVHHSLPQSRCLCHPLSRNEHYRGCRNIGQAASGGVRDTHVRVLHFVK